MSEPPPTPLNYATPSSRPRRRIGIALIIFALVMFLLFIGILFISLQRMVRFEAVGTLIITPTGPSVPITAPAVPSQLTIIQRQTAELPGTNGTLLASVGDITRGQVLLTITDVNGQKPLNSGSMRVGDIQTFTVLNQQYEIELVELKNFLTGDDFADFEIRLPGSRGGGASAPAPAR